MFPIKRQKGISSRKWCIFVHLCSTDFAPWWLQHGIAVNIIVSNHRSLFINLLINLHRQHHLKTLLRGPRAVWHHDSMAPWHYGTMTAGSNHKADPDKLHLCQTEPPTVVLMKMIISMILIAILWDMLKQVVV